MATLGSMNASEVSPPANWTPLFTGYNRVKFLSISGGTQFEVYIWSYPSDNGFDVANQACTKSWHSGGPGIDEGCYDAGTQCDVELRNGKTVIICCDEPQA
jgi:hypothetical protein